MENVNCWEPKFEACQYSDQLLNEIAYLNTMVRIPVDIKNIQKASFYARVYHGDQKRKSGDPYYSHPLIVAYLFAKYVGKNKQIYYTTELIVIAILHDTIEDTALTYDMIVEIFGKVIAEGVQDLTKIKDDIKITAEDSMDLMLLHRKKGIILVKMFDRLHNALTIHFMSPKKIISILRETIRKFLFSSIYTETPYIENELIAICLKHLPKHKIGYKLSSWDNSLLPSLD